MYSIPSKVLGWSVTHPVWIYSISCLKTSGSNSSMINVWCWLLRDWCLNENKSIHSLAILNIDFKLFCPVHSIDIWYSLSQFTCCWFWGVEPCRRGSELRFINAFSLLSFLTGSFFFDCCAREWVCQSCLWNTLKYEPKILETL